MAQATLKVAPSKVQDAIDKLTQKITKMEGLLDQIISKREKLARSYKGKAADEAVETIKAHEANVRKMIEATIKEKESLQNYITKMDSAEGEISSKFSDSRAKAQNMFK